MTRQNDNPDRENLERLLCERADGLLDAVALASLEARLAEDAGAAATARQYERLNALLRGWRVMPARVDFEGLNQRVRAAVSTECEVDESAPLDEMIRQAVAPLPHVDWAGLQSRISAAVQAEASKDMAAGRRTVARTNRWGWAARMAVPLAAAAAIAAAIWWPRSEPNSSKAPQFAKAPESGIPQPRSPRNSMVIVALDAPADAGKVSIFFDEQQRRAAAGEVLEAAGSGIAIGPAEAEGMDFVDESELY